MALRRLDYGDGRGVGGPLYVNPEHVVGLRGHSGGTTILLVGGKQILSERPVWMIRQILHPPEPIAEERHWSKE